MGRLFKCTQDINLVSTNKIHTAALVSISPNTSQQAITANTSCVSFQLIIGGIKPDSQSPGFKNVLLTPNFIEKLQHYESAHDGPFGKIISAWKKVNGNIEYNITIPADSTATILFPEVGSKNVYQYGKIIYSKNIFKVPSGTYQFIIK